MLISYSCHWSCRVLDIERRGGGAEGVCLNFVPGNIQKSSYQLQDTNHNRIIPYQKLLSVLDVYQKYCCE
jgi:hypothetical protein